MHICREWHTPGLIQPPTRLSLHRPALHHAALAHLTHWQVHPMSHVYMNAPRPCRPTSRLGHSSPDLLNWGPSHLAAHPRPSLRMPAHGRTCILHAPDLVYASPSPLAMSMHPCAFPSLRP